MSDRQDRLMKMILENLPILSPMQLESIRSYILDMLMELDNEASVKGNVE